MPINYGSNDVSTSGLITANSGILVGTGSAANPSYEFINDPDTGMFSPAANTIGLATSGVERLRINSVGNVGIGTSSPTSTLHVVGSGVFASGLSIFSNNRSFIDDFNNPAEASLRVSGVTYVDSLFAGGATAGGSLGHFASISTNGHGIFKTLGVGESYDTPGAAVTIGDADVGLTVNNTGGGGPACQLLPNYGAVINGNLIIERNAWIDISATVGIGTSTPSGALHVVGTSLFNGIVTCASGISNITAAVFKATDNQPPASSFATLDTRNSIAVLDFDDTTKETAVFVGIMPLLAPLSGGLSINIHWMATTATSGNCRWEVSMERSNTDLDSDSFDTAATGSSTTNATAGIVTVTSITLTTIDSVAVGNLYRLRISRDAANGADTMVGDAELVAVEVRSVA